jgi:hypothetical protein
MEGAMVAKKLWLFVCLVLFLAGCGGGRPGQKSPSSPGASRAPAADQAGADGFAGEPVDVAMSSEPSEPSATPPQSAPPPSSTGGGAEGRAERSREAEAPRPQDRPGLATQWGETRTSRVHDVTFVRDSSRPFAVATPHYNDRRGVDALVERVRETRHDVRAGGGAVTISVRDASGNPLEAVNTGDRTFVVGKAGQRYTIVLENHTSHRFEALATVDGLDVISGKDGSFANRGYVLMPFATLEIDGFRQSTSTVAAFRFGAVGDSYAAQMGKARNVGVIGVAFFTERGDAFIPESELRMRETASPFPADPRFAPPPPRR